jgi:hypothetical protein
MDPLEFFRLQCKFEVDTSSSVQFQRHFNKSSAREDGGSTLESLTKYETLSFKQNQQFSKQMISNARVLWDRGRHSDAVAELTRSLEILESIEGLLLRASMHKHLGDSSRCRHDYRRVLDLDPCVEEAVQYLEGRSTMRAQGSSAASTSGTRDEQQLSSDQRTSSSPEHSSSHTSRTKRQKHEKKEKKRKKEKERSQSKKMKAN